jgi:hypothetical protein
MLPAAGNGHELVGRVAAPRRDRRSTGRCCNPCRRLAAMSPG